METTAWLMIKRCARRAEAASSACARWLFAAMLAFMATGSWAGLSVYTSWSTLPPTTSANQRTIDFSTKTLASENAAGKITYSQSVGAATGCIFSLCSGTAGSVSLTSSSGLAGFSGNVASLTSGTTSNSTSLTINFTTPTPYVGFLWGVEFNAENSMQVNLTLVDNTVVTLKNCSSASNNLCVAKYVSSNWFTNIYNALLGWILGDSVTYYPIYMQYEPDNGVKIKSMQVLVKNCANCGFLSSDTSQDLKFDYITYVDASVVPHHLEVTTGAASTTVGSATNFTITACGDAACSVKYTSGVTGSLSISGVSAAATSIPFTIAAGPNNSTTVSATMTSAGTATIGLPSITPAPSNTPKVFCGMGVPASAAGSCDVAVVAAGPHHLELTTGSSSTLTCQPLTFTVKACSDASCSATYTGGVSGTLSIGGSSTGFDIASGSATISKSIYAGTAGTATASLGGLSVTPSNGVYCGVGGASATSNGSCNITVTSSGFVMTVPDHVSESSQGMTVQALSATASPTVCAPTFANGAVKSVIFKCSYTNPTSGTLAARIGGQALNASGNAAAACDGTGRAVSLTFAGLTGTASATFQYADVGRLQLTASYTGSASEPGLSINGTQSVIVAPANFAVTGVTSGTIKAGNAFGATVTARNAAGVATPNFGKELSPSIVTMSLTRAQPTGTGAKDGAFTGSLGAFAGGTATTSNLVWSEVGKGDVVATLSGGNYLGSTTPLVPTGSTGSSGAVGPFIPDHFNVTATNACTGFSFSGQPFTMKVKAQNASNGTTENYDGTTATTPTQGKDVMLCVNGNCANTLPLGKLKTPSINASDFVGGVATLSNTFTFGAKQTAPATIVLRATEAAGGNGVTSSGANDASMGLRSGRLKISNIFGSEKQSLVMQVQSQYWTGSAWILNAMDGCTTLTTPSVVLSGYRDNKGASTTAWTTTATPSNLSSVPSGLLVGGKGTITLTAPSPTATGSVDLALNLGDPNLADQSCLSTHGGTGAAQPWLRSQNGNCSAAFDRDPSARVTFGIYTPESSKTIHVRELY